MSERDRLQSLRTADVFRDRGEAALRSLLRHVDEVTVRAGERIVTEGTPCHQFVVVVSGRVESSTGGTRAELGPGDTAGWAAMRERGLNEAGMVALTDARLLVMSHEQFRAAEAAPPKRSFRFWALPTSRRSLPHRQHLERA